MTNNDYTIYFDEPISDTENMVLIDSTIDI
jgi:hypothetical protein